MTENINLIHSLQRTKKKTYCYEESREHLRTDIGSVPSELVRNREHSAVGRGVALDFFS